MTHQQWSREVKKCGNYKCMVFGAMPIRDDIKIVIDTAKMRMGKMRPAD